MNLSNRCGKYSIVTASQNEISVLIKIKKRLWSDELNINEHFNLFMYVKLIDHYARYK